MPLGAVVAALASASANSFLGIRLQTDTHRRMGFAVVSGAYVSSRWKNGLPQKLYPKNVNA